MAVLFITLICGAVGVLLGHRILREHRAVVRLSVGALMGSAAPHLIFVPTRYCVTDSQYHDLVTFHLLGAAWTLTTAYVVSVLAGSLIAAGALYAARFVGRTRNRGNSTGTFPSRGGLFPFLLLLPTLAHIVIFTYLPAIRTLRLGSQTARLGIDRTVESCLSNYTELIAGRTGNANYHLLNDGSLFRVEGAEFADVLRTSFVLTFLIIILTNVSALIISNYAARRFRGAGIYRALLIWPFLLSGVASALILRTIFAPETGLLNEVLAQVGIDAPEWLLSTAWAPVVVTVTASWNIVGFNILFYIAAMQNVPPHLLEAAELDGAGAWHRFRHVTFPSIAPVVLFLVFFNTTYSFFDTFGIIHNLTGGGPVNSTTNLIYNIYDQGILSKDLGRAAAQSLVLMVIAALVGLLQFKIAERRITYAS